MYRHILAAVEADETGKVVLARARDLANQAKARLSVLHVVEYLVDPAADALLTTPVDLSRERADAANETLCRWCRELEIAQDQVTVSIGSVTSEILRHAKEGHVDLIVLGHAPRSGLAALFNHTEEGVVSRADCDVLAVRLLV